MHAHTTRSLPDYETRMLKVKWDGTDVHWCRLLIKGWITKPWNWKWVQVLKRSTINNGLCYSSAVEKWVMAVMCPLNIMIKLLHLVQFVIIILNVLNGKCIAQWTSNTGKRYLWELCPQEILTLFKPAILWDFVKQTSYKGKLISEQLISEKHCLYIVWFINMKSHFFYKEKFPRV
jgi:hypothetical protein